MFKNTDRVTMMPAVLANGDVLPPLFIIKGKEISFRVIANFKTNQYNTETYFNCSTSGSLVVTRENLATVDSQQFSAWAKFCERITSHLTD